MKTLVIAVEDPRDEIVEVFEASGEFQVRVVSTVRELAARNSVSWLLFSPELTNPQRWLRFVAGHFQPSARPLCIGVLSDDITQTLEGVRFRPDVEIEGGSASRLLRKFREAMQQGPVAALRLEWASEDRVCEEGLEEAAKFLDRTPAPWMQRGRMLAALREAIRNALIHGNRRVPELDIRLQLRVIPGGCEAEVSDAGAGFDLASVLAGDGRMGRGLSVMRHAARRILPLPDGRGVRLEFEFQIEEGDADDELDFEDNLTLDESDQLTGEESLGT